jgi:hypothetical protein
MPAVCREAYSMLRGTAMVEERNMYLPLASS